MTTVVLIAAALVSVFVLGSWLHRRGEQVDLADPAARRKAAAAWMAGGEKDEAERMLRAATDVLDGFSQALARADLASLLTAEGRPDEALAQLRKACDIDATSPSQAEQALELRIQLAHLLTASGELAEAEEVLRGAEAGDGATVPAALAAEALAEFLVEQGRGAEAAELLSSATLALIDEGHDRAASAVVTFAHALSCSRAASPWRAFDDLPEDLQRAALLNFGDRLHQLAPVEAQKLTAALLQILEERDGWRSEREQLRAAKQHLDELVRTD